MTIEEILTALPEAKPAGMGYLVDCPAHAPGTVKPTLTIMDAAGGPQFHCTAGCTYTSILDAIKSKYGTMTAPPVEEPLEGSEPPNG